MNASMYAHTHARTHILLHIQMYKFHPTKMLYIPRGTYITYSKSGVFYNILFYETIDKELTYLGVESASGTYGPVVTVMFSRHALFLL